MLKVLAAAVAAVTLHRVVEQTFTTQTVTLTPGADGT